MVSPPATADRVAESSVFVSCDSCLSGIKLTSISRKPDVDLGRRLRPDRFFSEPEPLASRVDELLATNEVAVCRPVVTELRRGLKSVAARNKVLPRLSSCHWLDQPDDLWVEAGGLGFAIARRGVTVKTLDLLIAAYAVAHGAPILTLDADFEAIRKAGVHLTIAPWG